MPPLLKAVCVELLFDSLVTQLIRQCAQKYIVMNCQISFLFIIFTQN